MQALTMHSSKKSVCAGCLSLCLTLVSRRGNGMIIVACFLVIVFSGLFIGLTSPRVYQQHIHNEQPVVSETRHVHECHCLVNVSLPLEKQESIQKLPGSYPTDKMQNNPPKSKPQGRTAFPEHMLRSITLKPNFTRMINATQRVVTVNGSYILENPTLCSTVQNLAIMVIVHTSPNHKSRRFAIRTTWANDGFYRHLGNVRILFLLGKTKDPKSNIQTDILNEFNRYGDILQGDFIDDYHNLTLKGVMAYKWLTERCRNANLILKVDDDISVNMFRFFIDYYPKYRSENMSIICNHIISHTMTIIRKNDSKWFVNNNHFRGLAGYPTDYCSGFFVLFTNDLIPALYRSTKVTPFFWVDDVYLYGLVPGNVPGLKYIGLKGGWHQLSGQEALRCYRNATATCPFLVAGAGAPGEFEELWPEMSKNYAQGLH